jgi:multidrug resistance efflux pump
MTNRKVRRKNWLVMVLVWVAAVGVLAAVILWKLYFAGPLIP